MAYGRWRSVQCDACGRRPVCTERPHYIVRTVSELDRARADQRSELDQAKGAIAVGVDVDARDICGVMRLHAAAWSGNQERCMSGLANLEWASGGADVAKG